MEKMKVCIVGGVAGGMSCAMRLRRLREDIDIHIFERGPDVSVATCGMPYYLQGDITDRQKLSVVTAGFAKARFNVSVHTLTEVTAINRNGHTISTRNVETGEVSEHSYHKLVLCPGAKAISGNIAGVDLPGVFTMRNLADMDGVHKVLAPGKKAVVIGCSFIGLEIVEALVARQVQTTAIELGNRVLSVMDPEMTVPLHASLAVHGVDLRLGRKTLAIKRLDSGSLTVELDDGSSIPADVVVLCIGIKPDSTLAAAAGLDLGINGSILVDNHMRTSDSDIYACGDAVQVTNYQTGQSMLLALAGPASRQGRIVASNIAGREDRFAGVNGTAIVRLFEHTAAFAGLTEKAVQRASIPNVEKLYVVQANAVEWLPGFSPMIMKMLFDRKTERVLGVQAVGRIGVDKRIDIASTAIQMGMTVRQLAQLELTYAPPFNGPKDPLNTAGFIATNMLDGLVHMTYPDSLPNGAVLLDLREAPELGVQGSFPEGTLTFPMSTLRSRLDEIPRGKPLVAACKVGGRGNAATRLLLQKGFDVYNLSGGIMVWNLFHHPQMYERYVSSKFF